MIKKFFAAGLLATATAFAPGMVAAEYPEKPVEFVVPWPPGDLEDVLTRMIAEDFQAAYGVPAAVVNKPGGGGGPFPGAVEVANAPADGYTVGSFIIAIPVIGPDIGIPELNPNPFEPLGSFLTYPFVIVAGGDAPYDDIDGLAAYAQDNDVALGHFGAPLIPTQVTFAARAPTPSLLRPTVASGPDCRRADAGKGSRTHPGCSASVGPSPLPRSSQDSCLGFFSVETLGSAGLGAVIAPRSVPSSAC